MIYSNKNKIYIGFSIMLCLIHLNCVTIKADESLIYVKPQLSEGYLRNEVSSKYGDIWIGYRRITDSNVTTEAGTERFIIEKAYYYYMKDGNYNLLGSVDKTGLYDKNGSLLREVPRIVSGFQIAGISSYLFTHILGPALILHSVTDYNMWREGGPFVNIDIDTDQDTLKVRDMAQLFR